jgi:hypothetical protein
MACRQPRVDSRPAVAMLVIYPAAVQSYRGDPIMFVVAVGLMIINGSGVNW